MKTFQHIGSNLFVGILILVFRPMGPVYSQEKVPVITLFEVEKGKEIYRCNPGPWGDLEYYYTYLEAPDSIVELVNVPSQNTIWKFPGMTLEEIKLLFEKVGLSKEEQNQLFKASLPFSVEGDIRILPSSDFVRQLSPSARTVIYAVLRRWNENPFHRSPAIIENGNVKEWFKGSGLSENVISKIEKLTYSIGNSMAFSDLPLLLNNSTSDKEEHLILRAITRTRTMVITLRTSKDSDAGALAKYWTVNYQYTDALPALQSVLWIEEEEKTDITHFLPPTPRKYLYTFPSLATGLEGSYPDSFWTALNFFKYSPSEPPPSNDRMEEFTATTHDRQQQPFQFGDLIYIKNLKNGRIIQACVYIADGITYTKTGKSLLCPWIFIKLDNLVSRYQGDLQIEIEGWRHKAKKEKAPAGKLPFQP